MFPYRFRTGFNPPGQWTTTSASITTWPTFFTFNGEPFSVPYGLIPTTQDLIMPTNSKTTAAPTSKTSTRKKAVSKKAAPAVKPKAAASKKNKCRETHHQPTQSSSQKKPRHFQKGCPQKSDPKSNYPQSTPTQAGTIQAQSSICQPSGIAEKNCVKTSGKPKRR